MGMYYGPRSDRKASVDWWPIHSHLYRLIRTAATFRFLHTLIETRPRSVAYSSQSVEEHAAVLSKNRKTLNVPQYVETRKRSETYSSQHYIVEHLQRERTASEFTHNFNPWMVSLFPFLLMSVHPWILKL
jgi:hypothetical protein